MSDTSIGVVITTCDRYEGLVAALKSLEDQAELPQEIVVVDDFSMNPVTLEIFNNFPPQVNCKLIINNQRMGGNFSRNAGIDAVSSSFVLFLDDDDKFLPDKIKIVRNVLRDEKPDVIYHSALINYYDFNMSYKSRPEPLITVSKLICSNCVGATSMVGMRVGFLNGGKIFDESLPALQDWDAWISLAVNGAKFRYIDLALTDYCVRVADKSISKSVWKQQQSIEVINRKYRSEISMLTSIQKRRRLANIDSLFFLKSLLSGNKVDALVYAFRSFVRGGRLSVFIASVVSLFSLRLCVFLRSICYGSNR